MNPELLKGFLFQMEPFGVMIILMLIHVIIMSLIKLIRGGFSR